MKVSLLTHTPHPLDVLMFTKSTRLEMNPKLLETIAAMPAEDKVAEIEYMAKTIRSSWEFVDMIFLIEGITRATAQQITRTRNASFAMQSQRVADVSKMSIVNPFDPGTPHHGKFNHAARVAGVTYSDLLAEGAMKQDARGILPINVTTNLVAKYNLRNFVDLVVARESLRVTDEYCEVVRDMKTLLLAAMPWAAPFFVSRFDMAINILTEMANKAGITPGTGDGWELAKVIDMLKAAD